MSQTYETITAAKKALRTEMKAIRAGAFDRHGSAAGVALADHARGLLELCAGREGSATLTIAGFSAIRDEIDPLPAMMRLRALGHGLALPCMQGKDRPLVFRTWSPGDEMAPAVWGISEPLPTRDAVEPDVVLVPLLAFDRAGYRLGYGGGFYDRSLAELRARKPLVAVGVAYDEQRLDAVPRLDYDQPLDWVLTPSGLHSCGR